MSDNNISHSTTIKQFVKYFAEKQETRITRIKAIERLQQIIPEIKRDIQGCSKRKDSAQHKLIEVQIHTMTCLQDLKKQQHQIQEEIQKYQFKLKEMQQYRSQLQQTKQQKEALQLEIQSLSESHEHRKSQTKQKISRTKQKIEQLREKVFLKRQLASKNFMIEYQQKVINDCKANRDQFKNYIKQLEDVIAERQAAHEKNVKSIQQYVKSKVSTTKKQIQNNIQKQNQLIFKKLQETNNLQDFLMLLKIAGFNCAEVRLNPEEQFIMDIFQKEYQPLNFLTIAERYKDYEVKANHKQQQLDIFEKEIASKLLSTNNNIQKQTQQINLLQSKFHELSHKISKQNNK